LVAEQLQLRHGQHPAGAGGVAADEDRLAVLGAGEIIELPVEDGMAVKKGDLLIKIKPDSYKALVEGQEAAISGARAVNLQQKATLAKTELDLKRAQDLFDKKMISESEFSVAQTARDVAKSTYESSQHEIERAEAGSSQARDQLSKTTIYSPIDGMITVLNSKLGERVVATNQFAGTEVMRVADPGHMEARVDVNENDVVTVKVGDQASVKIDAYRDRRFRGTVQQIANTGKTTGAGTQEEVTNFEVKIRIVLLVVALETVIVNAQNQGFFRLVEYHLSLGAILLLVKLFELVESG
jgi:HlyD family secretion protein